MRADLVVGSMWGGAYGVCIFLHERKINDNVGMTSSKTTIYTAGDVLFC